jgi:excisionase family DNA binding protein
MTTLISPEAVAEICGLSRRAVYRAIERGDLRAFRLCSRLRIRPEDVEAWVRANEIVAPARDAVPRAAHAASRAAEGLRRLLPKD